MAVLILAEPWLVSMGSSLDRRNGDDGRAREIRDESRAVLQLCDLVSKVCIAVLVHFRDFRVVGSALQSALLKPLANVLTLSSDAEFFVLEAFLVHLSTVYGVVVELGHDDSSSNSSSSIIVVVQNTLRMMSHLFMEIRNALNSIAFSMKKNTYSPLCQNEDIIKAMLEAFRQETPY